jgi:hypothetical protein
MQWDLGIQDSIAYIGNATTVGIDPSSTVPEPDIIILKNL